MFHPNTIVRVSTIAIVALCVRAAGPTPTKHASHPADASSLSGSTSATPISIDADLSGYMVAVG